MTPGDETTTGDDLSSAPYKPFAPWRGDERSPDVSPKHTLPLGTHHPHTLGHSLGQVLGKTRKVEIGTTTTCFPFLVAASSDSTKAPNQPRHHFCHGLCTFLLWM